MANNYYNPSNAPATSSSLSSATMRAEFAAIGQAADKLAPLTGNGDKVLVVNPGGTAQTSKTAATVVAEAGAGVASKATPVDADGFMVVDTEASNALKRLTWANLKTAVKGYYDSVVSTLTNKTINLASNTVTGTLAQFNTAVSDADLASLAGAETLTNKTLSLSNNTLSGTKAQFNTALSDADFLTTADLVTVPQGGTGVATITGLVKGNGAAAMSAAVAGTDYQSAQSVTGMVKSSGVTRSAAVAGTDYTSPTGSEPLSNKTITGSTGAFTTLSATGKITSTYANGGGSDTPFSASHATGTGYGWSVTGQAVDGRNWDFVASGNTLALRTVNDANSVAANALRVTRSGNTVSTVETYAAGAVVSTASSTGVAVTGALSSTGRHSATSDQTTPTDGSAYFYKASAGAVLSGYQVMLETGSAGSRSTKVTVNNSGDLAVTGSVTIGSFTTATRPTHAAGKMIYVSDASAGSKFQGSDGSSWVSLG